MPYVRDKMTSVQILIREEGVEDIKIFKVPTSAFSSHGMTRYERLTFYAWTTICVD